MNEKHKKIYMILISSLFFIIIISWLLDHQNQNQSEVNVTTSMAEIQSKKENEFQINGFTLEHPNVILNPYGNSPLTALILFQTNNEVSPTVTIKGKDELSTFKHTFEKKKEHYLPIYGLYANQENQVLIEYEENGQKKKNTIQIQTDKLPDNMILPTEIKKEKSNPKTTMVKNDSEITTKDLEVININKSDANYNFITIKEMNEDVIDDEEIKTIKLSKALSNNIKPNLTYTFTFKIEDFTNDLEQLLEEGEIINISLKK